MESTPLEPSPSVPLPSPSPRSGPWALLALLLAVASAILLFAGILYGFASVNMTGGGADERFRLLGQAANPFIAALAVAASVLVAHDRRRATGDDDGVAGQAFGGAAIGLAATVGFATVLLGLNAVILDFTGPGSFTFQLSSAVSRVATILLAAYAVWVAATSNPSGRG